MSVMPAIGATPLATTVVSGTAARVYEWDLTEFVRAERAAGRYPHPYYWAAFVMQGEWR